MKNILGNVGAFSIGGIIVWLLLTTIGGYSRKAPEIRHVEVPTIQLVDTCLAKTDTIEVVPEQVVKKGKPKRVNHIPRPVEPEEVVVPNATLDLDTITWISEYEDRHLKIVDSMEIQGYLVGHTKEITLDTPVVSRIIHNTIVLDPGVKLEQVKTFYPERYDLIYASGSIQNFPWSYSVGAGWKTKGDWMFEVQKSLNIPEQVELKVNMPLFRIR